MEPDPAGSAASICRIEVAAGLIFYRGRLLITQRPLDKTYGGLWEFPGGKREHGEPWEKCLQRELLEELDIQVQVGSMIHETIHHTETHRILLRFFACQWISGEMKLLGCAALEWVERSALPNYKFPPADDELIRRLTGEERLWPVVEPLMDTDGH